MVLVVAAPEAPCSAVPPAVLGFSGDGVRRLGVVWRVVGWSGASVVVVVDLPASALGAV